MDSAITRDKRGMTQDCPVFNIPGLTREVSVKGVSVVTPSFLGSLGVPEVGTPVDKIIYPSHMLFLYKTRIPL